MASLSKAKEYLKKEAAVSTAEEAVEKPSKKKKKKKKKSSAATLEGEGFGHSSAEIASNVDKKPSSDDKTIAEKELEVKTGVLMDEKPLKNEETAKCVKDESKLHDTYDINKVLQSTNISTKKGKNKTITPAIHKNVADKKSKTVEVSTEVIKEKDNLLNCEKPRENKEVERIAHIPSDRDQSSSPVFERKRKKKKNKTGFLLSETLSEPHDGSHKERNDGKGLPVGKKNGEKKNNLSEFSSETSLLQHQTRERNNLTRIIIITYGLGLEILRMLFLDIHPNWSYKPDDAKNMVKGKMKLLSHEKTRFDSGDINSWDISLITTVLLYSKKCAKKLKSKPGYEDAIRTIKDQKNLLISHISSDRMSDDEFNTAWEKISKSLETLGASKKAIDDAQLDDVLEDAKFYRDLFLQEEAYKDAMLHNIHVKMDSMGEEVAEKVVQKLTGMSSANCKTPAPSLQDLSGPKWDEWLRFCDNVNDFDYEKNNYVLITDQMSPENVQHFSVLRSVAWKMVLDFDPSSEEHGMYHAFLRKDGQNSLINMITPEEIRRDYKSSMSLAKHIDSHKTQWLFVQGRDGDSLETVDPQDLHDWKATYLKHISGFLRCCSDPEKIDKHKPVVCLILPFREETIPFLKVTLERLEENFDECSLQFVGVKNESICQLDHEMHLTELTPMLLGVGLRSQLEVAIGKEYQMPTFQAKLPAKLTNHEYLYLQEYLDVMYDGCEDLPKVNNEEDKLKLNKILNEHKESFLSGNWISFVSLYDNHDARRELGDEIRSHIQRLLEHRPNYSAIIEIHHSPGTGGTTIARRVLWDLHKVFPCAIAKLEDYGFDFEEDFMFINALADRIGAMQESCRTIPLILLDGNHSSIENLSSKLVRVLNGKGQRVVLLSCMHSLFPAKDSDNEINLETTDVHARFYVNVKLGDSLPDINQFKEKYKDFIDRFKNMEQLSPQRVFHFPLLAMLVGLEGFDSKLKQIIHESFDGMDGIRKEIAAVVAFIQLYASHATPASLLYIAFKQHVSAGRSEKRITYEDINQLITDQLLSLMVPAKPSKNRYRTSSSNVSESYTLQHPLVAQMVLQRYYETQKRDIFLLTRDILNFPIFQSVEFFSLWIALFIRNRSSLPNARFSILFEELNCLNPRDAADIFQELAKITGDATVFAHAARFHARSNPPIFSNAKDLIAEAFKCENAHSHKRMISEIKGNILQSELRVLAEKNEIDSITKLEGMAKKAVESYMNSRNWPITYPWPLMGEVKVWISCIEWIIKNKCHGDTDKALEYMSSEAPSFFRTCVGDSLHLLDVVDEIVQKETNLSEPEEVQKYSNNLRMSLLKTFSKGASKRGGRRKANAHNDIIRACEAICTEDKFPKSSSFELKRLKVYYILDSIGQVETASTENITFLLNLLEELVFTNKQSIRTGMARHLMKVCLFSPKRYPLNKGMRVADMWIHESGYDPLPYFYKMMISFLMILDGNQIAYRDIYQKALEMCKEKSQNHCRRLVSTHFLKKTGEGMNRLMTKAALISGETEYPQNLDYFWTTISRKKLKECKGRIRIRSKSGKRKQVYIELVEGNIELYVGKSADIVNKVERQFTQGTIVYFVVSFNLDGPVANGITVKPTSLSIS